MAVARDNSRSQLMQSHHWKERKPKKKKNTEKTFSRLKLYREPVLFIPYDCRPVCARRIGIPIHEHTRTQMHTYGNGHGWYAFVFFFYFFFVERILYIKSKWNFFSRFGGWSFALSQSPRFACVFFYYTYVFFFLYMVIVVLMSCLW